ncbi:hypothetical protein [Desulfobulbus elongatus]|uniref:hypothetical protein n=1 Tax=Desulfobulbus elongatus TaxID=53332 RepID=UPI000482C32F|nr:hypothetical protein [Desulfobulbus elongatus]
MEQYLAGLTLRTSERLEGENGRRWVPVERPLTPADVLAVSDLGDTVVIVAADGRKHVIAKATAPPDDPDAGGGQGGDNPGPAEERAPEQTAADPAGGKKTGGKAK